MLTCCNSTSKLLAYNSRVSWSHLSHIGTLRSASCVSLALLPVSATAHNTVNARGLWSEIITSLIASILYLSYDTMFDKFYIINIISNSVKSQRHDETSTRYKRWNFTTRFTTTTDRLTQQSAPLTIYSRGPCPDSLLINRPVDVSTNQILWRPARTQYL